MGSLQTHAYDQLVKQGLMPPKVARRGRGPNKDATGISPRLQKRADRIVRIKRARKQGLTLEAIAEAEGISHQAVSKLLAKYGSSTAIEAREIYEARAAAAALYVTEKGRPADIVLVHKAIGVLPQDANPNQGMHITINGFALVGMGLAVQTHGEAERPIVDVQPLSPPLTQDMHSLSAEQAGAKGNIKPLIGQADSGQPNPAADSLGGPNREGKG